MKLPLLGLAGLLFAETAFACVCAGPFTAEQRQAAAARIAAEAVGIAEIELAQPMDHDAMRPEQYRVLTVHLGKVPEQFALARDFERTPTGEVLMTMTSCDVVPPPGERTLVVLYRGPGAGTFRIGGTCDHMFINSEGAVDLVRAEALRLGSAGERG